MNLKTKKYFLNLSIFILIFLFSIFALSNFGFILNLSINPFYVLISFVFSVFYLFKTEKFISKFLVVLFLFLISFIAANSLIDTSFDGRCYHFTLENLFKLGFNPIYDDIKIFANNHNIYYNLVFANSYPNALEVLRSNFYLLFAADLIATVEEHYDELLTGIEDACHHYRADRINPMDKCILLIAMGEILYFDDIPPVVSVSEATGLARKYSTETSADFVNGVLSGVINK